MSYRKSLKDTKKFNHDRVEMRCANQRRNLADLNAKVSNLQLEIKRLKEVIQLARDTAYSSTQDCSRCGFIDDLLTKALNEVMK